jgi:methionyl-tRNA formyltransferase
LYPWPHAYTYASGKRLIVLKSRVEERSTDAAPGTVVDVSRDHLQIAAGGGTHLALLEIQPEGRRAMPVRDFLAGHPLRLGSEFSSNPNSDPNSDPT